MLVGLFRILLILAVFYLLVKLFRYFFSSPSQSSQKTSGSTSRKEGEVHIEHTPDKSKVVRKDDGEYVDYEEVDE